MAQAKEPSPTARSQSKTDVLTKVVILYGRALNILGPTYDVDLLKMLLGWCRVTSEISVSAVSEPMTMSDDCFSAPSKARYEIRATARQENDKEDLHINSLYRRLPETLWSRRGNE
ncbi:hypothetical protein J6590_068328 [Homalodisca vitripennis]|nr:hypothetical protein J6590_068328 [Homalodisca vitripennis]